MKEIDVVILSLINKDGKKAKENIVKILCMNNKEKIKLLNYLYNLFINYNIIPSDERLEGEISKIIKEDK